MSHWETGGKSDNWYTPKFVFDALGCVFDLDVAGKLCGPYCVPTTRMFTSKIRFLREDGSVGISPSNGTALWATGFDAISALMKAEERDLGIVAKPMDFRGSHA